MADGMRFAAKSTSTQPRVRWVSRSNLLEEDGAARDLETLVDQRFGQSATLHREGQQTAEHEDHRSDAPVDCGVLLDLLGDRVAQREAEHETELQPELAAAVRTGLFAEGVVDCSAGSTEVEQVAVSEALESASSADDAVEGVLRLGVFAVAEQEEACCGEQRAEHEVQRGGHCGALEQEESAREEDGDEVDAG